MSDTNSNDVLENIYSRHSVRQFEEKAVKDELIKKILDAANQAPSAHNQQSWQFIVLRGDRKKELAQFVSKKSENFPKTSAAILRMAARSILSAPVVIAVKNTGSLISHGSELFQIDKEVSSNFFRTMEIQSSAAAVENLLLAATSLGLGSVWLGILYLIKNEVLDFLGEEQGEFMAVVPVGYPKKKQGGPKKKSLEYVLKELGE